MHQCFRNSLPGLKFIADTKNIKKNFFIQKQSPKRAILQSPKTSFSSFPPINPARNLTHSQQIISSKQYRLHNTRLNSACKCYCPAPTPVLTNLKNTSVTGIDKAKPSFCHTPKNIAHSKNAKPQFGVLLKNSEIISKKDLLSSNNKLLHN